MQTFTVVGVGEVLWDVFPTHKQLGGAPANFAYISSLLGERGIVASRIGEDALGDEVLERFRALELDTAYLQRDSRHPTGTVKVEISSDGQPKFDITQRVAWDFLEWTDAIATLAASCDAVCFGSLAQREQQSRDTIAKFLDATRKDAVRIFDVNLRQTFYSPHILSNSARRADILKLNHEEAPIVIKALGGLIGDERQSAQWLRQKFGLKLVCVTRGGAGSLLVSDSSADEHPGYAVQVADTVGAGDAFTATLVHHYLRGSSLRRMNDAASRMGAWVASQHGATPGKDKAMVDAVRAVS